MGFILSAFEHL